ncbi:hypothetical protein AB0A70_28895 [Streptomyces morookaense]|uniref:hypothetical protein n=1 Tax=Streptomyces morookaense TaxID=1970 RepID=UPI0033EC5125
MKSLHSLAAVALTAAGALAAVTPVAQAKDLPVYTCTSKLALHHQVDDHGRYYDTIGENCNVPNRTGGGENWASGVELLGNHLGNAEGDTTHPFKLRSAERTVVCDVPMRRNSLNQDVYGHTIRDGGRQLTNAHCRQVKGT